MKLFKNTSIGLDIADNSIEVVELNKSGQKVNVKSIGRAKLPSGIVVNGEIVDEKKLSESLKKLFSSTKPSPLEPKEIIFGLPESQVYTHIFTLPDHNKGDREELILKEAQFSIPIEPSNLLYSHKIIESTEIDKDKKEKQVIEVLLTATSTSVVLKWQAFFQSIGIEVETYDIETLASYRSLFEKTLSNSVCVIDLGARKTTVSNFDKGGLRSTYSTYIAGNNITLQISNSLSVSIEEAEKKKLSVDLGQAENEVSNIVINTLAPLIKEIKDSLGGVKEVILIGGLSQMKGLPAYLSSQLDIPVKIGVTPWLSKKLPLVYIEAVGLALRGLQKKWGDKDPEILAPDIEKIKKQKEKGAKKGAMAEIPKIKENQKFHLTNDKIKAGKLKKQKIVLLVILIVGVLIVSSLLWYRSYSRNQRALDSESQLVSYSEIQTFNLEIPVAIEAIQYTPDRVRGRIFEDEVTLSGSYNEALENSRRKAEKELVENEVLWQEPLDKVLNEESVEFPIKFRWFIYNENEANELFLEEINKINSDNVDFELNNIIKTGIEKTESKDIFSLKGDVSISLNELIKTETENKDVVEKKVDEEVTPEGTTSSVTILETPTGFLNVRSGPDTSFSKVSEVFPGSRFGVLDSNGDWVKIRVNDELQGWITTQYVQYVE